MEDRQSYQLDELYQQESARLYDCGFRLWYQGHLLVSRVQDLSAYSVLKKPSLHDEYRFVKKYWGAKWCMLIFVIRFFSFKNIFLEIPAFVASLKTKSQNLFSSPWQYHEYETFESPLIKDKPLVSVIIPTLNRYDMLADTLSDLEKQSYKNFEVIIVDQSDEFNEDYYAKFQLQLHIIHQNEKLLWTARNKAIQKARGKYLLFFDDDSRIEKDWIEEHLKCLDFFDAEISAGVSMAVSGGKISTSYNYFRWADQFDSGNAMVIRNVFERLGMFDEKFNNGRMGDGEFGIRAYLSGIRSISNCKAHRVHLKAPQGGLRETVSWDAFRPKKVLSPKPIPSVLYLIRKYFPSSSQHQYILQGMMLSNVGYKYKRSMVMMVLSICLFILKIPVLYYQYYISLRKSMELEMKANGIPLLNHTI